jgi:DNA-binding transcriptional ArsR family regulator
MPRTPSKPYLIETLPQLRALRSPARQEVLDAVQAAGPCSIAELGSLLGRAPDSLYYHARSLLRLGLLIETPPARPGARGVLLDVPGRPMTIRYKPGIPASRRALSATVASMLRLTSRDFAAGLASPDAVPEGPDRNLWAARIKARLTAAQSARLSSLLARAADLIVSASRKPPGPDTRLVALTFAMTPVSPRRAVAAPKAATASKATTARKGGSR